jgi:hypothetical protein
MGGVMNLGDVVYTKGDYEVVIGLHPVGPNDPPAIPVYLINNKVTGVTENVWNTLYNALQAADGLNEALDQHKKKQAAEIESLVVQGKLFN